MPPNHVQPTTPSCPWRGPLPSLHEKGENGAEPPPLREPPLEGDPQRDPGARGLHGRLEHHPFGMSAGWSPARDTIWIRPPRFRTGRADRCGWFDGSRIGGSGRESGVRRSGVRRSGTRRYAGGRPPPGWLFRNYSLKYQYDAAVDRLRRKAPTYADQTSSSPLHW